jgi:hypothetical protein
VEREDGLNIRFPRSELTAAIGVDIGVEAQWISSRFQ